MGQSASRTCCSGSGAEVLESFYYGEAPGLEPYGDISGIGVIIGFVGTGYLVLLLMIVNYLVSYDPTQSPWPGEEKRYRWHANPIDVIFLRWIRRIKPTDPNPFRGPASHLQRSIDKSILALCDVQLITGLGILTCAFILGSQCKLDAYHWQMIVHLAWFSVVTHLSGLFALRNRIAKSRWPKYVRVGIMFSLLAILLVATIPTIFFNWASNPTAAEANSRAICFLDLDYGVQRYRERQALLRDRFGIGTPSLQFTHQFEVATFSIILLVFGFTTRSVKLFGFLSRSSNMLIRAPLSSLGKNLVHKVTSRQPRWPFGLWDAAVQHPVLAIFIMLRIAVNLASSMLAEVYWLLCIVLLGNVKLISTRNSAGGNIIKEENEWTFGQILPVLLLVGPFTAISITLASDFCKAESSIHYANLSSSISLDSLNIPTQVERNMESERSDTNSATYIIPTEATPQGTEIPRIHESHSYSPTPSSHKDLKFWLDPEASMRHPWISTCSTMPSLVALGVTLVLFMSVYPANNPKPGVGLFKIWISYGILFTVLVDLPIACTGTVLVALRLNPPTPGQPRNFSRHFIFFWLCVIIYVVCCAGRWGLSNVSGLLSDTLSTLLQPHVFSILWALFLYIFYVLGCILSSALKS